MNHFSQQSPEEILSDLGADNPETFKPGAQQKKQEDRGARSRHERRPLPPVRWPEEFDSIRPPDELVDGVLILDSLSLIYGQPKCGKTFWVLDLALHIAHGLPWNGCQVKRGLVVYCAGESPVGVQFRVKAWHQRHGLRMADADFALLPAAPDLLHDDGHTDDLISVVRQAAEFRRKPARMVVIDTVHRALNGGDESGSADMGLLIGNVEWVRASTQAHVALIHHSGKDAARGSRGSNSLPAAVSTIIEITKDEVTGNRTATIADQRDLPDGGAFPFSLVPIDLGTWNDKPISSLAVGASSSLDYSTAADERRNRVARLKPHAAALYRLIVDAFASASAGQMVAPVPDMEPVRCMDRRNEMRGLFSTRGWFSDDMFSDPLSTVKTVNRKGIIFEQNNLRALERAKLAGFTGEWIWLL